MTIGERLKLIRGALSQDDFSKQLGVSKAAVGAYERDAQIPGSTFIISVCGHFHISHRWLLTGEGPMKDEEHAPDVPSQKPPHEPRTTPCTECARCQRLEAKLDKLEHQRDELVAVNQQLLIQCGDLKARCAALEERQKHYDPAGFFSKQQIPSSNKLTAP